MRVVISLIFASLLIGCTPEPQPINFGEDGCHFCKMTIVDQRYGAELVTKKGKVYKYDAVECLINAIYREKNIEQNEIHSMWTIDFGKPKTLVPVEKCSYLHSKNLPSPMGMFLTAFADQNKLKEAQSSAGGEVIDWEQVKEFVLNNGAIPDK